MFQLLELGEVEGSSALVNALPVVHLVAGAVLALLALNALNALLVDLVKLVALRGALGLSNGLRINDLGFRHLQKEEVRK